MKMMAVCCLLLIFFAGFSSWPNDGANKAKIKPHFIRGFECRLYQIQGMNQAN
jgi:hypothetical protein